ncbi:universal stress protein [Paraburkholderia oxyphila]|uniref:universal stress protein n=1 Tax=Paraburkholderia oxyphila TaxID=614212 RepID=UPI0005BB29EA|nr:universal stress protein [Paraburkholderia oxyphila]
MYGKIMVAIDASEASKCALAHGLRLASLLGSSLCVAHVIPVVAPFGMGIGLGMANLPVELFTAQRDEAHAQLAAAQRSAAALGVACEADLLELGSPADDVAQCLLRCAVRCGAELVVLGTHGRRGVRRALHGSVAERFARTSVCPVLLVHGRRRAGKDTRDHSATIRLAASPKC